MNKLIKNGEEIEKTNVVPFVKPEYKEEDPDWLWNQSLGTVLLVRQPSQFLGPGKGYHNNPVLMEFHVMQKRENPINKNRSVQLLTNLNTESFQWVDSRDFSKDFRLHDIEMKGEDLYRVD